MGGPPLKINATAHDLLSTAFDGIPKRMSAVNLPSGAAGIGFFIPDYHAISDSQRLAADFIAHYVMEYEMDGVEGEPAKRVFRLKQAI